MTTFSQAQLPSDIATVEQLAVWCNAVLTQVNGLNAIVEAANSVPERVAQYNIFQSPNDGVRHLARVNVPMNPELFSDKTKKYWMHAQELTVGAIPATFTTN